MNKKVKNAITEDMKTNEFAYTLAGGGSVQTGSKGVITLNLNRILQFWNKEKSNEEGLEGFYLYLEDVVKRVHKYLAAFNEIVYDYEASGLLPVYKAGHNSITKKYLTIGLQRFLREL